ncbi:protein Z, vitamin K-dependent plasma glycoprotein b [Fundulus diaphanus]
MAVHIMAASLLAVCLLGTFLQALSQGEVFRGAPGAHTVFLRPKRANQFFLEEILQGNLERECYEERCNYEEAREVFEDDKQTIAFWTFYYDGDQCTPNPCLNGGNCTDQVGGFSCSCRPPNYGHICELEPLAAKEVELVKPQYKAPVISACPTEGPKVCHQLCTADYYSHRCSCTSGFKLQSDKRSCQPEVEFPCGRIPDANGPFCRHGSCPWQVSLVNSSRAELCGGVVLGRRSVLTAARCLFLNSGTDPRPSQFHVVTGNRRVFPVQALFLHERFHPDHHDFDLALLELARPIGVGPGLAHPCLPTKDFSENILMHPGRVGVADRRGRGQNQELVYMTLEECRRQLSVPHPLSNKMFCMRSRKAAPGSPDGAARGTGSSGSSDTNQSLSRLSGRQNVTQNRLGGRALDRNQTQTEDVLTGNRAENLTKQHRGSPAGGGVLMAGSAVVTVEKGTAFLTGLLMSASSDGGGQAFTRVSRYLNWIRPRLEMAENHMTPQVSQYPEIR